MVRYVVRGNNKEMKLQSLVNECNDLFNVELNKTYISNILASMKEVLTVSKGKYNLYENININNEELESVRNRTEEFLLNKQVYTSSKVILKFIKQTYHDEYLMVLNGYFLHGILQDDNRFDCHKQGLMVGLNSSHFKAVNTDQVTEIIGLMRNESRPLKIEYIVNKMSPYRDVSKHNIKNLLETKSDIFYCSGPLNEFYLIDEKNDIKSTIESESTMSNKLRKQRKKKRLLKMASMLNNKNQE
jgi:hypothetical protein